MAGSINWSNYSSTQILQMQKLGVQVPDDVLAEATTTADQNFQTDDDVIREQADLEVEEFVNSEEFSSAKLKDQVTMLGEQQETKYKEAFNAAKAVGDIEEALSTLSTVIDDRISEFEVEMSEFDTSSGEVNDEMAKKCKTAQADILKLASGASASSDKIRDLNEKAIVAETFAEKTGEKADKFLGRRSAIRKTIGGLLGFGAAAALTPTGAGAAAFIGGSTVGGGAIFDNLLKGEKVKNAEHIKERSEHIVAESQSYESNAQAILQKMSSVAKKTDETVQNYKQLQNPPEQ